MYHIYSVWDQLDCGLLSDQSADSSLQLLVKQRKKGLRGDRVVVMHQIKREYEYHILTIYMIEIIKNKLIIENYVVVVLSGKELRRGVGSGS